MPTTAFFNWLLVRIVHRLTKCEQMAERGQPVPEDRAAELLRSEPSASLARLADGALLIA